MGVRSLVAESEDSCPTRHEAFLPTDQPSRLIQLRGALRILRRTPSSGVLTPAGTVYAAWEGAEDQA
jgi:hypothetical protein